MKTILDKQFFILFFTLISIIRVSAQDIFDYPNSLKYADHLFSVKNYKLSSSEYERICFLHPSDTTAQLRRIQSYRMLNDLDKAQSLLLKWTSDLSQTPQPFIVEQFKILFCKHQFDSCHLFLSRVKNINQNLRAQLEAETFLMQHCWKDAELVALKQLYSNAANADMNRILQLSTEGQSIRYKNPACAAIFSGIVPGSGKVYTLKWKDGIYAFLAVSSLSILSYKSFQQKGMNPYGFIFGSLAFTFYTSNVFGSYKSAIKHNDQKNKQLTNKVLLSTKF
jgi:hypothetical protein